MMLEQWHQTHEAAENRVSAPLLSG
jgi:hypothetical protein